MQNLELVLNGSVPQTDPVEFVQNICENMQRFPKPDFLTGDQLMFQYDPQVSRTLLQVLIPAQSELLDPVLTRSASGDRRRPDPVDAPPSQPAAAVSRERRPLPPQGEVVRYQLQLPGYNSHLPVSRF